MSTTTDPNDPRLTHRVDTEPTGMADVYLVLSEDERAKGFVRPYRESYRHVGTPGPTHPLQPLTSDQVDRYIDANYVKYEPYPPEMAPALGKFWTQAALDNIGNGCGGTTTMGRALAETYARQPTFYGATYCAYCQKHRPVGKDGEFVWTDGTRVGT